MMISCQSAVGRQHHEAVKHRLCRNARRLGRGIIPTYTPCGKTVQRNKRHAPNWVDGKLTWVAVALVVGLNAVVNQRSAFWGFIDFNGPQVSKSRKNKKIHIFAAGFTIRRGSICFELSVCIFFFFRRFFLPVELKVGNPNNIIYQVGSLFHFHPTGDYAMALGQAETKSD